MPSPSGRGIIIHNPYGAIVNPTVRMLNTPKKSTVQKNLKFWRQEKKLPRRDG